MGVAEVNAVGRTRYRYRDGFFTNTKTLTLARTKRDTDVRRVMCILTCMHTDVYIYRSSL